jgi:undecaprenyl diphosphate synthase
LMSLIRMHLRAELDFYRENGIRVQHAGDISTLPPEIASEISWVVKETSHFNKTTVVLAINYGGQDEIIRALHKIDPETISSITVDQFSRYLDLPSMPPVDLMIRTGGEKRISNFLMWQASYAELFFSDQLWPDWNGDNLEEAIRDYESRDRRFGTVK